MRKVQAVVNLVNGAAHAKPAASVGANMAQYVGRLSKYPGQYRFFEFQGTKQVLNGRTIVQGTIVDDVFSNGAIGRDGARKYITRITQQSENGSKSVSRIIPEFSDNFTAPGDLTKITTTSSAQIGTHKVNTFNQMSYRYGSYGLNIEERTIDRVFAGKKHIGGRAIFRDKDGFKKVFFGPDGKPLKTVYLNAKGIRTMAVLSDGRRIRYDAKGLPVPTTAYGSLMNLGGLDKLL